MPIDNRSLILPLLKFDPEYFYWGQVIKRRKENPNLKNNSVVISQWFFSSLENWEDKTNDMIEECKHHNARCYIHLNRRSWEKVGLHALELMAKHNKVKDYKAMKNAYFSACGICKSDNLTWIFDVDNPLRKIDCAHTVAKIPTPNGYHLIVKPHDTRDTVTGLDIHRDSPTILFAC